jgi:hypothetical protein
LKKNNDYFLLETRTDSIVLSHGKYLNDQISQNIDLLNAGDGGVAGMFSSSRHKIILPFTKILLQYDTLFLNSAERDSLRYLRVTPW